LRGSLLCLPLALLSFTFGPHLGRHLRPDLLLVFNPALRSRRPRFFLPYMLGPPLSRHLFFPLPGRFRAAFGFGPVPRFFFRSPLCGQSSLALLIVRRPLSRIANDAICLVEFLHAAMRVQRLILIWVILECQTLKRCLHHLRLGRRIDL
jgi:hypothetical protein